MVGNYRYEDPSYENVHVQWQNGFEFGRSRDYDPNPNYHQQRPMLQRARSESPTFSNQQRRLQRQAAQAQQQQQQQQQSKPPGSPDPYKNYKLNTENNSFKPKVAEELEGAVGGAVVEKAASPEVELEVVDPVNLSDNETETTSSSPNNLPGSSNLNEQHE